MSGDVFDQNRGLNKQEEKDFLKQGDIDQIKQEVGGDLQKLEKTIITNYHSENFDKIGEQKITQIKGVVGEDFYNQNYKLKKGGAEGISALQIMAIKCVDILNGEKVENILKSKYISSWPVDGILGPNTLYMLKEISKTDLGGDPIPEWNGVIDNNLLNKMLNICGIQKDGTDDRIEKKETTSEEITPVITEEAVETPSEPIKEEAKEEEEKVVPEVEDEVESDFVPLDPSQQEQPEEIPQNPEEIAPVIQEEAAKTPREPVKETTTEQKKEVVVSEVEEGAEDGFNPIDGSQQEKPEEIPPNPEEIAPVIQEEPVKASTEPVRKTATEQKKEVVVSEVEDGLEEFNSLDPSQQEDKKETTSEEITPVITKEPVKEIPKEPVREGLNQEINPKVRADFTSDYLKNIELNVVGIGYPELLDRVNSIQNAEVKDKIKEFLIKGDVIGMQKYLGMKDGSRYDDNRADGILGRNTLNRMTNPLFALKGEESLKKNNIPQDLIDIYNRFESENLNENKNYAIISKSDFNMYIFDFNHKLITAHPVGLGKTRGDQKNEAYKKGASTTPGGMYRVDSRKDYPNEYAGPGEYVALYPEESQYDVDNHLNFTLGYHNYFKGNGLGDARKIILQEKNLSRRRMSNGCINTLSEGSIYDNLGVGSKVYVTLGK